MVNNYTIKTTYYDRKMEETIGVGKPIYIIYDNQIISAPTFR